MKTSESIAKLAEALAKAQGQMGAAIKGENNPFFKSKYSDLASVIDAIKVPLSENGLSFVQATDFDESSGVIVETRLMHSSGEWIESRIKMTPAKQDAQGIGSCVTYAKRYGLQALVGVPSDDDDGEGAAGRRESGGGGNGMGDVAIAGYMAEMDAAATVADLQAAFSAAYKAAESIKDKPLMASFIRAKDLRKKAIDLSLKTMPTYPQADFDKNLPAWLNLISTGKKTADQIIAMVGSKATLTEQQQITIRAVHQVEAPTGEMSEAERAEAVAREMKESQQ